MNQYATYGTSIPTQARLPNVGQMMGQYDQFMSAVPRQGMGRGMQDRLRAGRARTNTELTRAVVPEAAKMHYDYTRQAADEGLAIQNFLNQRYRKVADHNLGQQNTLLNLLMGIS